MNEISVILCTARSDYPIIGLDRVHVLQPTLYSLEKQTFREFELIIVDSLYPAKKEWIEERKWSFPIKYVPPHPNHRFWLDRGLWNVAGMLNTALLYAEGELIVRLDDCSEIPDVNYLQKLWDAYKNGFFALTMHVRYNAGKPARINEEYFEKGYEARYAKSFETEDIKALLERLYGKNGIVKDTRWQTVERHGRMVAPPEWFYGFSSFSLEAALKVNGFNEQCDGQKGLEDVEFGERLAIAGYKNMFLLDKDLWVIEHEHLPCMVKSPPTFKCNYGLIQYEKIKGLFRANSWKLTLEDCEWIRSNICPKCLNYSRCLKETLKGQFYVDNELFRLWLQNQPLFDLRLERLEVS
jgi:glycosyltransferase involved in cell wall biosynthesis